MLWTPPLHTPLTTPRVRATCHLLPRPARHSLPNLSIMCHLLLPRTGPPRRGLRRLAHLQSLLRLPSLSLFSLSLLPLSLLSRLSLFPHLLPLKERYLSPLSVSSDICCRQVLGIWCLSGGVLGICGGSRRDAPLCSLTLSRSLAVPLPHGFLRCGIGRGGPTDCCSRCRCCACCPPSRRLV